MRLKGIRLDDSRGPSWWKVGGASDATGVPTKLREVTSFGDNPGSLRMFAYAPLQLSERAPLVVILHGCGQTAADYEAGTGWTELADALGFAVLAPEQTRSNNANNCFNWFQPSDVTCGHGEGASIRQMIERIVADNRLDRRRIFITGLSAGGAMAAAMLAAYPEVFAGGAIIAGVPAGAAFNVAEALSAMRRAPDKTPNEWGDFVRNSSGNRGRWPSISVWHGDADAIVNRDNADALLAQWTNVHGLPLEPSRTEYDGNNRHHIWQGQNGDVLVEAFDISAMGHGVPLGGPAAHRYGKPGSFFLDVGLSSTIRIAAFWHFDIKQAKKKEMPKPPKDERSSFSLHVPHGIRSERVEGIIQKALRSVGLIKR